MQIKQVVVNKATVCCKVTCEFENESLIASTYIFGILWLYWIEQCRDQTRKHGVEREEQDWQRTLSRGSNLGHQSAAHETVSSYLIIAFSQKLKGCWLEVN